MSVSWSRLESARAAAVESNSLRTKKCISDLKSPTRFGHFNQLPQLLQLKVATLSNNYPVVLGVKMPPDSFRWYWKVGCSIPKIYIFLLLVCSLHSVWPAFKLGDETTNCLQLQQTTVTLSI